ncbi:type II toxin-antitoxin system VapC family toxin [Thioalkalivibrio sp. XN8]|uniref:PIN domain-containing protein n=1 Tax=Thioalkalivibrio sp. XN8 TaxID=2712863 RepID=UPI0013EE011A|nr:type II toxin-antitoxin system VapC family toxin [Thioalkalivibrio sp. XN8]
MLYLDTSALLPFYREEATSAVVERLLLAQREPVLLSRLSELEVASALARWMRLRELDEGQAGQIENAFREDVRAGRFQVVEPGPGDYSRAREWLLARKTALRVLDALHLACAVRHEARLVTADAVMTGAAVSFGLQVERIGPGRARKPRRR